MRPRGNREERELANGDENARFYSTLEGGYFVLYVAASDWLEPFGDVDGRHVRMVTGIKDMPPMGDVWHWVVANDTWYRWAKNGLNWRTIRASPAVLSMLSYTVKFDEKKSKYAGLAQGIGFGWASLHSLGSLGWLAKGAATLCTCRKDCNKYDPICGQCFWLANHNDWPMWFAISSPSPICCPSFSFMDGVAKK